MCVGRKQSCRGRAPCHMQSDQGRAPTLTSAAPCPSSCLGLQSVLPLVRDCGFRAECMCAWLGSSSPKWPCCHTPPVPSSSAGTFSSRPFGVKSPLHQVLPAHFALDTCSQAAVGAIQNSARLHFSAVVKEYSSHQVWRSAVLTPGFLRL